MHNLKQAERLLQEERTRLRQEAVSLCAEFNAARKARYEECKQAMERARTRADRHAQRARFPRMSVTVREDTLGPSASWVTHSLYGKGDAMTAWPTRIRMRKKYGLADIDIVNNAADEAEVELVRATEVQLSVLREQAALIEVVLRKLSAAIKAASR